MATSWRAIGGNCRALMSAAKSAAAAAVSKAPKPKVPKKTSPGAAAPAGILKPVTVSAQLGQFLGASEASRTLAIKKIWEHIKAHDLQNPTNKREILCDQTLKTMFGNDKEKVNMLEIPGLISKHFIKTG